jgi:hypothetical protein
MRNGGQAAHSAAISSSERDYKARSVPCSAAALGIYGDFLSKTYTRREEDLGTGNRGNWPEETNAREIADCRLASKITICSNLNWKRAVPRGMKLANLSKKDDLHPIPLTFCQKRGIRAECD